MTDTDQTFDERWNAYWEERRAAEKAGDKEKLEALVPTFFALSDEQTRERDRAISEALDHAGEDRTPDGRPIQLSGMERAAIESEVNHVLDVLDGERELISEDLKQEVAAVYASEMATDSRLKLKCLVAFHMEGDVGGGSWVEDGILGRKLDEAIEEMLPYSRKLAERGEGFVLHSEPERLAGPAS